MGGHQKIGGDAVAHSRLLLACMGQFCRGQSLPAARSRLRAVHSDSISARHSQPVDVSAQGPSTPVGMTEWGDLNIPTQAKTGIDGVFATVVV